ncbi:hypothetical protein HJG60_011273 [Phyllostomus discolor]|uniref:Uncharacterized protein n=1 Tax=Phyllostomus discolor TaxID=89673 RepID=A0A834A2A0_9CHIR|nr:hypothetical protein HJG60_011273 [Phyllostomus discolor]
MLHMQKMVVERLVAACRDETCALSLPLSHSRLPLVFSHTHGRWHRGRCTRSPAQTASHAHQACSSPEHRCVPRVPSLSEPHCLRAPLAPRLGGLHLWVLTEVPYPPDTGEPFWKWVFLSPYHSLGPSSHLPLSEEGPALGMNTLSAPLFAFLAPVSRLHLAQNWPVGQVCSRAQGRGEFVPPRPPAPCCILAGSRGGPAASLPYSPRFSLSLALFCHWAARGELRSALQQISHQQTARDSGEPETEHRTDEVKGLKKGEEENGRQGQPGQV